jgi:hypothetical protein
MKISEPGRYVTGAEGCGKKSWNSQEAFGDLFRRD